MATAANSNGKNPIRVSGKRTLIVAEGTELQIFHEPKAQTSKQQDVGNTASDEQSASDEGWETVRRTKTKTANANKKPDPVQKQKSQRMLSKPAAVVVKAENRSFADLVKDIKRCVDPMVAAEVVHIRRAGEAGVELTLSNNAVRGHELREAITKTVSGTSAYLRGGETAIYIRGMDSDTDEMQVLEAVCKALELNKNSETIKVKNLRPAFRGTQNATVTLGKEEGKKLLALGKIKVGWTICQLRLREPPARCFKCWSTDGHMASSCNGVDRGACCFNCAKAGHVAAECKSQPKCVNCDETGHRTGAVTCKAGEDGKSQPRL